ncbi:hypothetical protein [Paenibacillus sp. 1P07SE]|uniref:hypothetical protein n=1 Tax=Paenibacillus sp. 1P07SE TaxID=3132209 RepID=UPI0039A62A85
MIRDGFSKFFWGFLFIMFNFRIQGFDILPDVIGFILFAVGFRTLARESDSFERAKLFNFGLIFLSLFSLYQSPNREGEFNPLGFFVGIATLVLLLIVVHHLLAGIKDMASRQERPDLVAEAGQKWTYFLVFQIATLLLFVMILIPPLFVVMGLALFVVAIVLMIILMRFMSRCGEQL